MNDDCSQTVEASSMIYSQSIYITLKISGYIFTEIPEVIHRNEIIYSEPKQQPSRLISHHLPV